MRPWLPVAILSASTLLTSAVLAQTPVEGNGPPDDVHTFRAGQLHTIHQNVSLVILDGVAVDKQGHVVTDLKQSDFHVLEDGAPQTVRNFEEAGKYTPAADVTINSMADLARLAPHAPVNIVLLDEFTTRFEDMAYARYSLKRWLDSQPAKLDTPTMLVAVSLQKFDVLREYTQDKNEILSALNKHFVAYPWHYNQIEWTGDMYNTTHMALRRVAESTVSHRGPKTMIWIGRGLPSNRGLAFRSVNISVNSVTSQTLNELREARVALYTIDPAGLLVNPQMAYPSSPFMPFGGDPRFQAMAEATGGRNFDNRNDVDNEIGTSIRDGSSVYTLTYIPPDPDHNPDKLRHIQVTVDRPGVKFIARQAYFPSARAHRLSDDGTRMGRTIGASMVAAADTNLKYDSVHFTATVSPTDPTSVHVHLDGKGISYVIPKDENEPRYTRLIVMATTFDKKDKQLKRQTMGYKSTVPEAPHRGHVVRPIDVDFKLDDIAKATRVRFVVRVEFSGIMGTVDLPLTPGATASSAPEDTTAKLTGEMAPAAPSGK